MKVIRSLSRLVLSLALLLGGCAPKTDPLEAAKTFLQHVANGRTHEAYQATAFSFQAQQSEKAFAQIIRELGLLDAVSADAETPEVKDREATVQVAVKTLDGKTLPCVLTLVQQSGAWRVYALRAPKPGAPGRSVNRFSVLGKNPDFLEGTARPVPEDLELKRMADETLVMFRAAIRDKSFSDFYDWVAAGWQERLTLGQLQRAFQPFIDSEVDLSIIQNVAPVFDKTPVVNTDGILSLEGHYPTVPNPVTFRLEFIYELPRWKLYGMSVNVHR